MGDNESSTNEKTVTTEGPVAEATVIVDSHFEEVNSQGNTKEYEDGAMAAALREAGLIPPDDEEKPQNTTTSETPTPEVTEKKQVNETPQTVPTAPSTISTAEFINKAQEDSKNKMEELNKNLKKLDGMNEEKKKIEQGINDIHTPEGQGKEQKPESKQPEISKEDLAYVLNNPKIQELMREVLKEKREEDGKNQYEDENGNLVKIPTPIKEEMDKTFDKEMRVANVEDAARYANQENELYNRRIAEMRKEFKENGYTDSQIDSYMEIAKHDIKLEIQQYVKGTVTRDLRNRVIDRVKGNPDKYKEYIDPKTGEVIDSIKDENLIGKILAQKVYPKWQQGEIDALKRTKEKEKEIVPPEKKKFKRWGLVGGALGFTAAIAGGASVGLPVAIGAGILSAGASIAEKYAPKKIATLTERLANAKTPEEKASLEKRIKVWNFVNKHAHNTVKFFRGMALGAGVGTAISNFFMGGKGLVEIVGDKSGQATLGHGINGTETGAQSQAGSGTETGASSSQAPSNLDSGATSGTNAENLANTNNSISAETNIGINTNDGVLLKNGRVELPGSAWDGNLATEPLGNLPNGALNSSNFAGGATNMGAFNLESALQSNGVTESLLRNNLQTPEIHRLLNIFTSNPSTDLSTALQSLNSEGARTILEAISG